MSKVLVRILLLTVCLVLLTGLGGYFYMFQMPGTSYDQEPPELTSTEQTQKKRLRDHVETLAQDIGNRSLRKYDSLQQAQRYIQETFQNFGYDPTVRTFEVEGKEVANLEVKRPGNTKPNEIVVIGAHYDTVSNPGADDNASGVSGLLELSRRFRNRHPERTLRFVAFVNEEPPYYQTEKMGSLVYARRARERNENIVAMVSLEMLGYFSEEQGSQTYPFPVSTFYPDTGDFIAFVGNVSNRSLVRRSIGVFRRHARISSEGGALPGYLPGVGSSDHWAFWQEEFPAIMVTDTAMFRNPNYHTSDDLPETLDFVKMTRVVEGLEKVVEDLSF